MKETCETQQKPQTIKEALRSSWLWKPLSGVIVGAVLGFLYYRFVGCSSGSCAITGNPYMSSLFGAAMGFYVANGSCSRC